MKFSLIAFVCIACLQVSIYSVSAMSTKDPLFCFGHDGKQRARTLPRNSNEPYSIWHKIVERDNVQNNYLKQKRFIEFHPILLDHKLITKDIKVNRKANGLFSYSTELTRNKYKHNDLPLNIPSNPYEEHEGMQPFVDHFSGVKSQSPKKEASNDKTYGKNKETTYNMQYEQWPQEGHDVMNVAQNFAFYVVKNTKEPFYPFLRSGHVTRMNPKEVKSGHEMSSHFNNFINTGSTDDEFYNVPMVGTLSSVAYENTGMNKFVDNNLRSELHYSKNVYPKEQEWETLDILNANDQRFGIFTEPHIQTEDIENFVDVPALKVNLLEKEMELRRNEQSYTNPDYISADIHDDTGKEKQTEGIFIMDDSHCAIIAIKSCIDDNDCSCHGLYYCTTKGMCSRYPNTVPEANSSEEKDENRNDDKDILWHDVSVDIE